MRGGLRPEIRLNGQKGNYSKKQQQPDSGVNPITKYEAPVQRKDRKPDTVKESARTKKNWNCPKFS